MSVFFSSRKTVFKKLARHLLNTSSIASYLSSFLKLFLIAISIAPRHLVDRSRKFLTSRQLLDTWWIDRASFLLLVFFFLDSFSTLYLLTLLFLNTFSTDGSTPPRHLICQDLLASLYKAPVRSNSYFHRSLSLDTSLFLSQKHSNLTPILVLKDFSSFSSLGKLLILSHSCISCFET